MDGEHIAETSECGFLISENGERSRRDEKPRGRGGGGGYWKIGKDKERGRREKESKEGEREQQEITRNKETRI